MPKTNVQINCSKTGLNPSSTSASKSTNSILFLSPSCGGTINVTTTSTGKPDTTLFGQSSIAVPNDNNGIVMEMGATGDFTLNFVPKADPQTTGGTGTLKVNN